MTDLTSIADAAITAALAIGASHTEVQFYFTSFTQFIHVLEFFLVHVSNYFNIL